MGVITIDRETAQGPVATASVVIVAPDAETGRQAKAWVDLAGGFSACVLSYHTTTREALSALRPGIIMLAVRDPVTGLKQCRQLRQSSDLPLVVCSWNASEEEIVGALETGADEYVVIPTQPKALGARLRAVLRRSADWATADEPKPLLSAGPFEIRPHGQRVYRSGHPIELSSIEFRLLEALMRRPGRLVTHAQLLAEVWGPQYVDSRNYLRLYVQYLREKIEDDPRHPRFIVNEWGVGYRFEPVSRMRSPRRRRAAA